MCFRVWVSQMVERKAGVERVGDGDGCGLQEGVSQVAAMVNKMKSFRFIGVLKVPILGCIIG